MILRCCLTLFLLALPISAQHMNEKDSPCAGIAVTADLVECLSKARSSADVKLDAMYKRVQQTLRTRSDTWPDTKDDAQRLQNAQRLWLQYRDANCAAERDLYNGGTGGPPTYLACMEAMARARTKEMQVMYGWLVEKFDSAARPNRIN